MVDETGGRSAGDPEAADDDKELEALADDPLMGRLKTLFDDVADEPLPDDLMNLLNKLDEAERSR
ncbi:MAG: NepR family anti-sigma factor [Pseudomonadota bacterium]